MEEKTLKCSIENNAGRTWYRKTEFKDFAPPDAWFEIKPNKSILLDLLNLPPSLGKILSFEVLCDRAEKNELLWETEGGPIYDSIDQDIQEFNDGPTLSM